MPKLNSTMKQITSGTSAKLEVDLDELFGTLAPDSSGFRQRVGQAIIDKIRERTEEQNVGIDGKSFKKYSKDYIDTIEFKAYGKSPSDVNLKQTGDMLGLMDIIEEQKNKIVIGWTDEKDEAKAHNHITGDTVPKRNFLGLPESDLDEIKAKFEDELVIGDAQSETTVGLVQDFLNASGTTGTRTLSEILKIIAGDEG